MLLLAKACSFLFFNRRAEGKKRKVEDADLLCVKSLCSKFGLSIEEHTDVPSIKDSKPPEVYTLDRTGGGLWRCDHFPNCSATSTFPPSKLCCHTKLSG